MAGLRWFKVSSDLMRHKKSVALAGRLHDERAWAYVVQMWAWFCEQAGDGTQTGPDAAFLIARGAGWEGEADEFCRHMVAVGFLDVVAEGFRVHDWEEWAGAHVEYQKRDAERKRTSRGQSKPGPVDVQWTSDGPPTDRPQDCLSNLSSSSLGSSSEGGAGGNEPPPPSWPLLEQFRLALADRMVLPATYFRVSQAELVAETRDSLEQELRRLGTSRAVELAAQAGFKKTPRPRYLRFYLRVLQDAPAADAPAPDSAPLPAPDLAWLAAHPGAAERWAEYEREVKGKSRPSELAAQLEAALWMLRNEFETEAA